MIELKLKLKNEVVWPEIFPDQESCDKWLNKAMTEPGWNPDYVVEIVDKTEEVLQKEEEVRVEREKKENKKNNKLKDLKALYKKKDRTLEESNLLINGLCEILFEKDLAN